MINTTRISKSGKYKTLPWNSKFFSRGSISWKSNEYGSAHPEKEIYPTPFLLPSPSSFQQQWNHLWTDRDFYLSYFFESVGRPYPSALLWGATKYFSLALVRLWRHPQTEPRDYGPWTISTAAERGPLKLIFRRRYCSLRAKFSWHRSVIAFEFQARRH